MFRWLAFLIYDRDHVEFIEGLNGYIAESGKQMLNAARRARNNPPPLPERPLSHFEEEIYVARHRQLPPLLTSHSGDPLWARVESRRKRELLEHELEDAEWILEHDNRRTTLKKRVDRARARASHAGRSTETLDALAAHLRGGQR